MFGLGKSDLDKGLEAFAQRTWKRARKHLEESAVDAPSATGDYHLGLLYWRGLGGERDVRAAVSCFERAAKEGHVAAQTAFAMALRSGVGIRPDASEARKLFRAAAAGDDVEAMLQLATLSEPDEAKHWLERASEMGHPGAMRHLSDLLVHEQPVEALAWLYASITLTGDEAAGKRAEALAREMTADEISAAQKSGRAHVRNMGRARR
jgi:TPR repeat protein